MHSFNDHCVCFQRIYNIYTIDRSVVDSEIDADASTYLTSFMMSGNTRIKRKSTGTALIRMKLGWMLQYNTELVRTYTTVFVCLDGWIKVELQ
jgi:hypothetical protein